MCRLQKYSAGANIQQSLDKVEQNIGICQWRADQLFSSASADN